MLSVLRTIARHLPREVKDRIPVSFRARYQRKLRDANRKAVNNLDNVTRQLESLAATPFAQWVTEGTKDWTELSSVVEPSAVEINDSCNLNCLMCRTGESKRSKALMDLGLFDEILAMLHESGVRTTNFHTVGDPTANKRLPDYLALMRKHGMRLTKLSSNCQMLDRQIDTIFEYQDVIGSMRPSIDAASKLVYESIRIKGSWEVLHRNLAAFADRNQSLGNPIYVDVSNVVMKRNFHEVGLIPHIFSYLCDPVSHNFTFANGIGYAALDFGEENYFSGQQVPMSPCHQPWSSLVYLNDGRVSGCCYDFDGEVIFGQFKDGDYKEVFNSDQARAIRRAHLDGNADAMPPLCRKCFMIDPRFSAVINGTIQHFYGNVKRHPIYLQNALNLIGPMLQQGQFKDIQAVVESL